MSLIIITLVSMIVLIFMAWSLPILNTTTPLAMPTWWQSLKEAEEWHQKYGTFMPTDVAIILCLDLKAVADYKRHVNG